MYLYYQVFIPDKSNAAKQEVKSVQTENNLDILANGQPQTKGIDNQAIIQDGHVTNTSDVSEHFDTKSLDNVTTSGLENAIVETFEKKTIAPSKGYLRIIRLKEKKEQTKDRRERAEINVEIRKIKGKTYKSPNVYFPKNITDVNGSIIGSVYVSAEKKTQEGDIFVGDMRYINDISFDFVMSKLGEVYLRTRAYLTKEGSEHLESYVKKYLKSNSRRVFQYSKKVIMKSNSEIRRSLKNRTTYSLELEGITVHANLNGRIEIYTDTGQSSKLLCDSSQLSKEQKHILNRFAQYTSLKKWVMHTDAELNKLIGNSFFTLSHAINAIYQGYEGDNYRIV